MTRLKRRTINLNRLLELTNTLNTNIVKEILVKTFKEDNDESLIAKVILGVAVFDITYMKSCSFSCASYILTDQLSILEKEGNVKVTYTI